MSRSTSLRNLTLQGVKKSFTMSSLPSSFIRRKLLPKFFPPGMRIKRAIASHHVDVPVVIRSQPLARLPDATGLIPSAWSSIVPSSLMSWHHTQKARPIAISTEREVKDAVTQQKCCPLFVKTRVEDALALARIRRIIR